MLNCWDYGEEAKQAISTVLAELERVNLENEHLKSHSDYETICLKNNNLQEQLDMSCDILKIYEKQLRDSIKNWNV